MNLKLTKTSLSKRSQVLTIELLNLGLALIKKA
jgi:hypothetical protein